MNAGQEPHYESARHIAVLQNGSPGILALLALCSRLGDGANGTYDVLPGYDPVVGGEAAWAFGAGVPAAEVDVDAFIEAGTAVPDWAYVIDDEIDVADFLADFCLATQTIWYITREGLLSLRPLQERVGAPTFTLADDVEESTIAIDEESIFPRVTLRCGYDPIEREHTQSVSIVDTAMAQRYPQRGDAVERESRVVRLTPSGSDGPRLALPEMPLAQVEALLRRWMVEDGRGRLVLTAATHLDALVLELGEMIGISLDLPDMEGGSTAGRRGRVIGFEPRVADGIVDLEVALIETPYVIAPAAIITAVAGGDTLTLGTGPETDGTGDPARMFGSLWRCRIYDVSAATSELVYASAISDTELLLGATPAMTIEVGVDFITVADNDERDHTTANTAGLTPDDCLYQQADDESIAGDEILTRWR